MHLPELTLAAGCLSSDRSRLSPVVEAKRVVEEGDAQIFAVLALHQRIDGLVDAIAEGALEVADLDDGHERLGVPFGDRITHRNLVDRLRVQALLDGVRVAVDVVISRHSSRRRSALLAEIEAGTAGD